MTRLAVAVAAVALAAAVPVAHAGDDAATLLDRARQAIDQVDYDGARKLADEALEQGGLRTADLARAHHVAGEIAAALGDADGARDHFVRWILLDPDAALPAGASPKLTEPFDAARAEARRLGPMRFEVTTTAHSGRFTLELGGKDPLHLAARLHVLVPGGDPVDGHVPSVEVDAGAGAFTATVEVLDDRDDVLARLPVTVAPPRHAAPPRQHRVPAAVRWPTWTVIAAASAGAAGYFGWRVGKDQRDLDALNAASANHSYDEARAIEDRGRRDALITNVAVGVAAAAAVGAVVTFVIDRRKVEVEPLGVPGTAGASVTVHF